VSRLSSRDELVVWLGFADPQMERAPLALIGDLLRRVLGIIDGEDLGSRRQKLLKRVASVPAASRDRVARFLGEIAGAAVR